MLHCEMFFYVHTFFDDYKFNMYLGTESIIAILQIARRTNILLLPRDYNYIIYASLKILRYLLNILFEFEILF